MSSSGLDFARAQLEKYGWKEGKGLGRNEDGIKEPLKPALKFDNVGLGCTVMSDEFTSRWWEKAFNKVAKNINVVASEVDVKVQQENQDELFKSKDTRPFSVFSPTDYKSFIKTDTWTGEGLMKISELSSNTGISPENDAPVTSGSFLTDEEIFQACGGRTAHKGARHGLKLNGKLARIQRQEQELLLKYQSYQHNSLASDFEKREANKKTKKPKIESVLEGTTNGMESQCVLPSEESEKKKDYLNKLNDSLNSFKRKKRKKSFKIECSETISDIDGTVNYTNFSLPSETVTDHKKKISDKKKKKKEYEGIEEVMNFAVADTFIPEPHKKRKKKNENYYTAHSDITNPSVSKTNKKQKGKKNLEY